MGFSRRCCGQGCFFLFGGGLIALRIFFPLDGGWRNTGRDDPVGLAKTGKELLEVAVALLATDGSCQGSPLDRQDAPVGQMGSLILRPAVPADQRLIETHQGRQAGLRHRLRVSRLGGFGPVFGLVVVGLALFFHKRF